MIAWLKKLFGTNKAIPKEDAALDKWYHVTFDEASIYRDVKPPGKTGYNDQLDWSDIIRVGFQSSGVNFSDDLYIFTSERPESYLIPLDANGGDALWHEIIQRGYFDRKLAIEIAATAYGFAYWPPEQPDKPDAP